jgi:hypothetical protein
LARKPVLWLLLGFPNCPDKARTAASRAAGNTGVVALQSR